MKQLICFLLGLISFVASSQTPLLERKVTISLKNERLDVSLKKISQAGDFIFSYNPSIIDPISW